MKINTISNTKTDSKLRKNTVQEYIPYQQWPEYFLVSDVPQGFKPQLVTYGNILAVSWHAGPLTIEACVSQIEPPIQNSSKNRLIYWQQIYSDKIPKGWHTGFFAKSPLKIGYTVLRDEDYYKDWPANTRYYRRKWIKDFLTIKYSIERVQLFEYKEAYLKSSVVKVVGLRQIQKLEKKMLVASEHIDLWCARRLIDGKIVAGLGVLNSQIYHSSNHFSAFVHESAKEDRVSLGLIDHWFKESLAHNITILDFGIFWQKGDPRSWKGFSEFKGQFNITFISLPPRLFKIFL